MDNIALKEELIQLIKNTHTLESEIADLLKNYYSLELYFGDEFSDWYKVIKEDFSVEVATCQIKISLLVPYQGSRIRFSAYSTIYAEKEFDDITYSSKLSKITISDNINVNLLADNFGKDNNNYFIINEERLGKGIFVFIGEVEPKLNQFLKDKLSRYVLTFKNTDSQIEVHEDLSLVNSINSNINNFYDTMKMLFLSEDSFKKIVNKMDHSLPIIIQNICKEDLCLNLNNMLTINGIIRTCKKV